MTEDSKLYADSLEYVRKSFSDIYNKSEDTMILSLSRKGPKLLERIFGREGYVHYNTITEVALPFCMRKIAEHETGFSIKIFDDAIYFGTTVEGVCKELVNFENLYGKHTDKEIYTAIRARESKLSLKENLCDIEIHAYKGNENDLLREGYGHYFIRHLAYDLESCNNTLEIDFPIVEFSFSDIINRNSLLEGCRKVYGYGNVYESGRIENRNITILLDDMPGRAFRKLRIYIDGRKVRVVCMAPWLIPNDVTVILGLFMGTPWNSLWDELVDACLGIINGKRNFDVYALSKVERSIRKSLVILANYILSYDLIRTEFFKLLEIFHGTERTFKYEGVQINDLFYLLGDYNLCRKVQLMFRDAWNLFDQTGQDDIFMPNMKERGEKNDYQVFESDGFPEKDELQVFKLANEKMLSRCIDEQEALSALLYNQTLLIEKWSRHNEKYDFSRLRFGYTFQSLLKEVMGLFPEADGKQELRIIHQWVDHRIDQACIVPQYVVDYKTNLWCRVFRPGENEDALLNHLSRFVLFVFMTINKVMKLGWVNSTLLRELLVLSFSDDYRDELDDSFDFKLEPDFEQRELYFILKRQENRRSVFEYIKDMGVLTEENNMVSMSQELIDEEMVKATTLDKSLQDRIEKKIITIAQQIVSNRYNRDPFFITNFYFFKASELPKLKALNTQVQTMLKNGVNELKNTNVNNVFINEFIDIYYSTRDYIVSIGLLNNEELVMQLPLSLDERQEYLMQQIMLWRAKLTCDLIITAFLQQDKRMITNELSDSPGGYIIKGCNLWLQKNTLEDLKHIVDSSDSMDEIRKSVLSVVIERVKNMTDVNLNDYEHTMPEDASKF